MKIPKEVHRARRKDSSMARATFFCVRYAYNCRMRTTKPMVVFRLDRRFSRTLSSSSMAVLGKAEIRSEIKRQAASRTEKAFTAEELYQLLSSMAKMLSGMKLAGRLPHPMKPSHF